MESDVRRVPLHGIELYKDEATGEYLCGYVGWGGHHRELRAESVAWLGFSFGSKRRRNGVLHDIALGWLSGFPVSAIIWYLLSRTLMPKRLREHVFAWEARTNRYDGRVRKYKVAEPIHYYRALEKGWSR